MVIKLCWKVYRHNSCVQRLGKQWVDVVVSVVSACCVCVELLIYHIFIFLVGGLLKSVEGTPARNIENWPQSSVNCRRKVLRALRLLQAWLWFSMIFSMSRTSVWAWVTAESSVDCMVGRERHTDWSYRYSTVQWTYNTHYITYTLAYM